jgi:hypothetical protein
MTSSASSATWLPTAIARAAVVAAPSCPTTRATGRHRAPDVPATMAFATLEELARTGRHAEPEWSRGLFDPKRDEIGSLSWLGFAERH